jgi:ATP-dependent DNA helicase RecG
VFLPECLKPVETLRGVGSVLRERLARLGLTTIADLLMHFPRDYQDRRRLDRLAEAAEKERVNVLVRVVASRWIGRGYPRTLKVQVEDESGRASLLCFGRAFLSKVLLPDRRFWLSGRFQRQHGELVCSTFELEPHDPGEASRSFGRILPLYPLTEGLSQTALRVLMGRALEWAEPRLQDALPPALRARRDLPGIREALRGLHLPDSEDKLERARRGLAYTELFAYQLALGRARRERLAATRSRPRHAQKLKAALLARLAFRLTGDQERALAEIEADLLGPHPAARLLQGEVGSGKTLVAFLAALSVIEAGEQAALLAPTELLARQQADAAARLLEPLGVRVAFLSGGVQGEARESLRRALAGGQIDFLVGTHALFSEDIHYHRLGMAIIDEQHRFGVRQRQAFLAKGPSPDLLLMSATPIPRTLALALFGDLELSEIRELPTGRLPVITHLTREGNESKVYERVRQEVKGGGQAYFVYPLIEESEDRELKHAEGMLQTLKKQVFTEFRLDLIHSRLAEEEKIRVMAEFASGQVQILVATSVLEVGMDVANASCIVVEHAERFGLSALHQLRGRVGRGARQSYAFLIYSAELTESGKQRLKAIMETGDGFAIAEEDLRIRGPGEFLGLRQSGIFKMAVADLARDWDTLLAAREDALGLLEKDPGLVAPEHAPLSRLLAAARPAGSGEEERDADHGWLL